MTIELITHEEEKNLSLSDCNAQFGLTIKSMLESAISVKVDNQFAYNTITKLYQGARDIKAAIESTRKKLVEPFRKEVNAINDKAKAFSGPLDEIITIANQKASSYQALLEKQKQEEETKIREAAALFDISDALYIPPLEKTIHGDGASTYTVISKTFVVKDLSLVPLKYMQVNEDLINRDLKLGINEIPGLEITETKTTQLRKR